MTKPLAGRRQLLLFHAVCFAVYFASYCTRINYNAAITAIAANLDIAKKQAGIVSTGLFVTYGIGQLVSGYLGDRIAPHKLVLAGLLGASICNILMGCASNLTFMIVLWCVNGFCQAMFWPPLVRIMSETLDENEYKKAVISVSVGSTAATVLMYILVPICITLSGWRSVFFICSGVSISITLVWVPYMRKLQSEGFYSDKPTVKIAAPVAKAEIVTVSFGKLVELAGLIPIFCGIVLHGMLKDGVQTWMPAFIDETYHLGTSISILTTVILPIFATLSYPVATWFKKKLRGSELNTASFFFALAAVCSIILLLCYRVSSVLSIPLMAIVNASMHGLNLMLISHVPQHFGSYGCVSTVSGLLNCATYVGSATSTWGVALLSETFGWSFTIGIWAVIAVVGLAVLLTVRKRWNRFSGEE